jgi:hypothetical protein
MCVLLASSLIDWQKRYAGQNNWRMPLKVEEWLEPRVIAHRDELRKALDARVLSGRA